MNEYEKDQREENLTRLRTATFAEDHRKSNPGLHMFYTKNAVKFLTMADRAIKRFYACSNVHTADFAEVLRDERARKVESNAAFAEAAEIIFSIRAPK